MPPEHRTRLRLAALLAVLVPALLAGTAVFVGTGGSLPRLAGGGEDPAELAQLAAAAPLRPVNAEPGAAALGAERLERLAGGVRPAPPARIFIPAAGVDAPVEAVAAEGDALAVPDVGTAGWYSGGPRPGERGRAVVVGHLDGKTRPGLFARVPELPPGTRVSVLDRRGEVHRYNVVGSAQVSRTDFPAKHVYGSADAPVLVLVTCGGEFVPGRGYSDNVLLYARAA